MTTASAMSGTTRRRPSLGRWRGVIAVVVTIVGAYLLIYLGVIYSAANLVPPQTLSLNAALSQAQQQFINAITIGGIYALIALGDVFMVGSFVSWWLLTTLGFSGAISNPLELAVILALAFLVSMAAMGI